MRSARLRALKNDQWLADGYSLAFPHAHFGDDAPFEMLDGFLAAVGVDHAGGDGASVKVCEIAPTAKNGHKQQHCRIAHACRNANVRLQWAGYHGRTAMQRHGQRAGLTAGRRPLQSGEAQRARQHHREFVDI